MHVQSRQKNLTNCVKYEGKSLKNRLNYQIMTLCWWICVGEMFLKELQVSWMLWLIFLSSYVQIIEGSESPSIFFFLEPRLRLYHTQNLYYHQHKHNDKSSWYLICPVSHGLGLHFQSSAGWRKSGCTLDSLSQCWHKTQACIFPPNMRFLHAKRPLPRSDPTTLLLSAFCHLKLAFTSIKGCVSLEGSGLLHWAQHRKCQLLFWTFAVQL